MEELSILEQKVVLLVELIEKLQAQLERFRLENEVLHKEVTELHVENTHFVEENVLLTEKIEILSLESSELKKLNQEKEYTRQVIDDLIKSIESLEKEPQL